MKATLDMTSVKTGKVLDTITVDGAQVRYATGRARHLFESRVGVEGSVTAAVKSLADWSNGYLHVVRR